MKWGRFRVLDTFGKMRFNKRGGTQLCTRKFQEFGGQYNCKHRFVQSKEVRQPGDLAFATTFGVERKRSLRLWSSTAHSPSHRDEQLGAVARRSAVPGAIWVGGLAAALLLRAAFRQRQRTLQEGIADFYDASTPVWVEIWGDHLHHGYYEDKSVLVSLVRFILVGVRSDSACPAEDNSWRSLKQHKEAQVRMIEEVLSWAEVASNAAPKTILDVGCGVGGSSRHLQRKYGANVTGITLSPKQQEQARLLSSKSGQANSCEFRVADALNMPFEDNSFDLVWSLESGEHMPEKVRRLGKETNARLARLPHWRDTQVHE